MFGSQVLTALVQGCAFENNHTTTEEPLRAHAEAATFETKLYNSAGSKCSAESWQLAL